MRPDLDRFLASVRLHSRLAPEAESEVVRELQTHLEDEIAELCEAGFSATDAVDMATKRFGSAKDVGREIYETYSGGTWAQALLSSIPHLLIAVTFALHLWLASSWLLFVALVVWGVTIYAWYHRRPAWFYSWLGMSLMILLLAGFLLVFTIGRALALLLLGSSMLWLAGLAFIAAALCLLGYIVIRIARRDWLFASLMLLPLLVILVWLVALEYDAGLMEYVKRGFQSSDLEVALTFLAVGGVAGIFIRLKQRLLKISVLSVGTLLVLAMVWRFADTDLNPVASFSLSLFLVSLLMSPAILQHGARQRRGEVELPDKALSEQIVGRT